MSDTVLTVIGSIVGVAAFGVMVAGGIFFWKLLNKAQASSIASLARSAAAHGWQFEHSSKMGEIRRTWSGTTDGVNWVASHTGLKSNSADQAYWNHTFRWRATLENGPSSPLVLIHERSKLDGFDEKLQMLPGIIRGLASKAVDHVPTIFFGPEAANVELSSWVEVEGHKIPGMKVMAPVADTRAFSLARKLAPPIVSESAALAAGGKPPVILIKPDAAHLATTSDISDADLERAVRLGVGIAKALAPR